MLCAALGVGAVSAGHPAGQPRHQADAPAGDGDGARLAREHKLVADDARSAARFRNDQAAQNYVELEGGGKPAFAQLVTGTVYSPYYWEVRLFKPGDVEEVVIRFRPTAPSTALRAALPETYVRDAARKALDPAAALDLANGDRRARLGRRLRAVSQDRGVAGNAADGARRPQFRVRARRGDRRRAHPAASHGGRRRTDRCDALRARAGEVRAALRGDAQREQHDRELRQYRGGRAVWHRRLHPRRAVAAAGALAAVAVRRWWRGPSSAR